ncbi:MAG: hypothetical protein ACTSV3_05250 [Candidatus Thorarchaeota archaeon]|nr:MAG: hypothetical protein DRO87_13010 [Candidatus Thorarchaeota archaeon]RLI56389.1 MAG: hypothetical protein DRP09_06305 [Candidatus Thorarchaeota archaeon]
MSLEILRDGFVAFIDGLWWGLRDNTGPLSMYEGYSNGFRQMGMEAAEKLGGKGPDAAASVAGQVLTAIGLDVEVKGPEITVRSCPIWNRILERGLEFSFHIEEICWRPLLEGIGEKTGAQPVVESSLRLLHIEKSKVEYKKGKAKKALDAGKLSAEEYNKQIDMLEASLENLAETGRYLFK